MFQRGPGEGFHAAKDEALAIEHGLKCFNATELVGAPFYVVIRGGGLRTGKRVGRGGRIARDAWASALAALKAPSQ